MFNASPPYDLIELGGRGLNYRSYSWVAIFTDYTIFNFGPFNLPRLCGLFFEPGLLGTLCVWLLGANVLIVPKDRLAKAALFIMGLMTLSLAFAVAGVFILFAWSLRKGSFRVIGRLAAIAIVLASLYFILPGPIQDGIDKHLLSRMMWDAETGALVGDTRKGYNEIFSFYLANATPAQLAFGNGVFSNVRLASGYSSYHLLLHEFGFIGTFLFFSFAAYICFRPLITGRGFLWIFISSVGLLLLFYQRPQVFAVFPVLYMASCWQISNNAGFFRKSVPLHRRRFYPVN